MSDVRLNPYLNFQGNCREAFDFYASVLRAEISFLITMGESPMASEVPPECHNNICHVCLKGEGIVLMGSDCPPDVYEKPQGTIINVQAETAERAEAIFTALSEGGEIRMPMEETFWAERFGMCTDASGCRGWSIATNPCRSVAVAFGLRRPGRVDAACLPAHAPVYLCHEQYTCQR